MKLRLEAKKLDFATGEPISVRITATNEGSGSETLDLRLMVGPNPVPQHPVGIPFPISVEPPFAKEEKNLISLNPGSFYGRERVFEIVNPGHLMLFGYLLKWPAAALLPQGPQDETALWIAAEPLRLLIHDSH